MSLSRRDRSFAKQRSSNSRSHLGATPSRRLQSGSDLSTEASVSDTSSPSNAFWPVSIS